MTRSYGLNNHRPTFEVFFKPQRSSGIKFPDLKLRYKINLGLKNPRGLKMIAKVEEPYLRGF